MSFVFGRSGMVFSYRRSRQESFKKYITALALWATSCNWILLSIRFDSVSLEWWSSFPKTFSFFLITTQTTLSLLWSFFLFHMHSIATHNLVFFFLKYWFRVISRQLNDEQQHAPEPEVPVDEEAETTSSNSTRTILRDSRLDLPPSSLPLFPLLDPLSFCTLSESSARKLKIAQLEENERNTIRGIDFEFEILDN